MGSCVCVCVGGVNNWIKAFRSNQKQHDVLEGAKSRHEGVLLGVPQGAVLCPLLFLTYIKNMLECFTHADDSLLYRGGK